MLLPVPLILLLLLFYLLTQMYTKFSFSTADDWNMIKANILICKSCKSNCLVFIFRSITQYFTLFATKKKKIKTQSLWFQFDLYGAYDGNKMKYDKKRYGKTLKSQMNPYIIALHCTKNIYTYTIIENDTAAEENKISNFILFVV